MAEIPDDIVQAVVALHARLPKKARLDDHKEDLLDHAFDELGFDGDEEKLWSAVSRAIEGPPAAPRPMHSGRPGGQAGRPRATPSWNPTRDGELLTAPFRFVPLNETVSRIAPEDPTPLHQPKKGNLSAVLDVTWRVETPLLVGESANDGTIAPFTIGDSFAIPGATLRGALRSVLEIAAFGRLFQTNRHQRFGLRDFEHPDYKAFIQRGQGTPGLQAGFLRKTANGPVIHPCNWGYVEISGLLGTSEDAVLRAWVKSDRAKKYRQHGVVWTGPDAFGPDTRRAFADAGEDNGRRLYVPVVERGRSGVLVFAGAVPMGNTGAIKKRFEYVFFEPEGKGVPLDDAVWQSFETANCKPSQNKRKPDGAWAEFHETYKAGGRVPIFFIGDLAHNGTDQSFSFGLTRLYRLPHRQSIGDVLLHTGTNRPHRPAAYIDGEWRIDPDFVEHLFGYVYEPDEQSFGHEFSTEHAARDYHPPHSLARKGRIAVGFAWPTEPDALSLWPEDGPVTTVMGPPKPSFAPYYLAGLEKDYGATGVRLAGRKRYIPRQRAGENTGVSHMRALLEAQVVEGLSEDVRSRLRFIAPGPEACFRGRIRLHNVSPAELGAVLWALTFGGDRGARHQIGRGKAFGAGQMAVTEIALNLRPNGGKPYDPVTWRANGDDASISTYLEAFASEMGRHLGSAEKWRQSSEIGALIKAAQPRGWQEPGTLYLPYHPDGGKQAETFTELRRKTGIGAKDKPAGQRPPYRLLEP